MKDRQLDLDSIVYVRLIENRNLGNHHSRLHR